MKHGQKCRLGKWYLLAMATASMGYQLSCLGAYQREIEVMFAPMAGNTAYLIPFSILFNLFGSAIWTVANWLT